MQVLCLDNVSKRHCCLRKIKDIMTFLAEYGKFDSEWFSRVVWSAESRFQLHADVFEDLVRKTLNTNIFQLLNCLKPTLSGTTLTPPSVKSYPQIYPQGLNKRNQRKIYLFV